MSSTPGRKLRLVGLLAGDLNSQPDMRIKYGAFFEALARQVDLVDTYDVSLKGIDRWMNAAQSFDPDRKKWKERFFKNVAAFDQRTLRAADYLRSRRGQFDVALQLGALFTTAQEKTQQAAAPTVIYTDYTAALSARRPDAGRTPFRPDDLKAWVARETLAYQRAEHIFVRAGFVRQSLICDYSIPAEKITRIGAGVNFSRLPEIPNRASQTDPTLLFIGKDFYRKGGDLLLQAFARVREGIPNARLLLVTGGPIPAGLPLAGVTVLPPTWDRAAVEALYQQANIFVLPSRLETWGDVLLEAMAYALPCVGVRGEAMEEIILDGITGRVIPPDSTPDLAAALLELCASPELRQAWGMAARKRVEQMYTWNRVVEHLSRVLSLVVQPSLSKTPFY